MKTHQAIGLLAVWAVVSGCHPNEAETNTDPAPGASVMEARFTAAPVVVDGKLDDPVWQEAKAYPMQIMGDQEAQGRFMEEGGQVQLAWDDANLYLGIRFTDSDVVAENDEDQTHHFQTGDVAEVFLRPANQTYYWELYSTPHARRSSYFMPGKGRFSLPGNFTYKMEYAVASTIDGTLNDWRDKDVSWTTEFRIPIAELERHGDSFGPDEPWTIVIARYNYSRYLTQDRGAELSTSPQLPVSNFHYLEGYGRLELAREPD